MHMRAQRKGRAIAPNHSLTRLYELGGQHHVTASSPAGNRPGADFTEGRLEIGAGLVGCGKYLPYQDSIPRQSIT